MRGMLELSEAFLHTHLSAKRSSKAKSQGRIKLGILRIQRWSIKMKEFGEGEGEKNGDRKAKAYTKQ